MRTFFLIYWLPAFIPFVIESFAWRKRYKDADKQFIKDYQKA